LRLIRSEAGIVLHDLCRRCWKPTRPRWASWSGVSPHGGVGRRGGARTACWPWSPRASRATRWSWPGAGASASVSPSAYSALAGARGGAVRCRRRADRLPRRPAAARPLGGLRPSVLVAHGPPAGGLLARAQVPPYPGPLPRLDGNARLPGRYHQAAARQVQLLPRPERRRRGGQAGLRRHHPCRQRQLPALLRGRGDGLRPSGVSRRQGPREGRHHRQARPLPRTPGA